MAENNQIQPKFKKSSGPGYLIQGIITFGIIVISFGITLFVYLPYVQDIQDQQVKQKTLRDEINILQAKYDKINNTNKEELATNLTLAKKLIPDDIKIAELATFINDNAAKFNLVVNRLNLSENKVDVRTELSVQDKEKLIGRTPGQEVILGRIEGPFSLSGNKEDIFRFLDFIVEGGYATNFDKVTISGSEQGGWTVTFTAVHHYLMPVTKVNPDAPIVEPRLDLLKAATE